MDEYYKNIELGLDLYDWLYILIMIIIGIVLMVSPESGMIVGIIPMFIAIIKLILGDKDYHQMIWLFILGILSISMSGWFLGEAFTGVLFIITGIMLYLTLTGVIKW